jgi:hypothetical protein
MRRDLTRADVRLGWQGRIVAAPLWAFVVVKGKSYVAYEPYLPCWGKLLERLHREADQDHKRWTATLKADAEESAPDGALPDAERHTFYKGWLESHEGSSPPTVGAPRFVSYRWYRRRLPYRCVVCGKEFLGNGVACYCSDACCEKNKAPYKSQARPHAEVACARCGKVFRQARKDAVYCTGKCRVAAHRAKASNP